MRKTMRLCAICMVLLLCASAGAGDFPDALYVNDATLYSIVIYGDWEIAENEENRTEFQVGGETLASIAYFPPGAPPDTERSEESFLGLYPAAHGMADGEHIYHIAAPQGGHYVLRYAEDDERLRLCMHSFEIMEDALPPGTIDRAEDARVHIELRADAHITISREADALSPDSLLEEKGETLLLERAAEGAVFCDEEEGADYIARRYCYWPEGEEDPVEVLQTVYSRADARIFVEAIYPQLFPEKTREFLGFFGDSLTLATR